MNKTGKRICSAVFTMIMAVALLAGVPAGDMKEVEAATTLRNPIKNSNGVVTWDCVYFGNYPQSDTTGRTKDPIKWRVLSVNGKDAFLMADTMLDRRKYNDTDVDVTWKNSTMRSWLNGYGSGSNVCRKDFRSKNFIDRAFTKTEQKAIITTKVVNKDNPKYGTDGGKDTKDKVFLLSYKEATNPAYGFSSGDTEYDIVRRRTLTAYVTKEETDDGDTGYWWLRSPGERPGRAMDVHSYDFNWRGYDVNYDGNFVCPVLHLDLSSSKCWSYAGTVSSDRIMLDDGIYKVTKATASKQEVTYVKPKNSKKTSVSVPDIIRLDWNDYKVTRIADNAFADNKNLRKVTIGKNVTFIGKNAFNGDRRLKLINIQSKKLTSKRIGENAFKGTNMKLVIKVPRSKAKVYKKFLTKKGNARVRVKKN